MSISKRGLRRIAVALGGGIAAIGMAVPAQAQTTPDPQTTNVPYTAWRGEHIRLVKCSPLITGDGQSADVIIEDWSGPNPERSMPALVSRSVRFFEADGMGCVRATVVAVKPGLAQVKLAVSDDASGDTILTHQFLAAWLNLTTPTITEVAATDQTGSPALGDPLGDGVFYAGANAGHIQVRVSGTLPLLGNFAELGLGDSVTLPADWARLAAALATDADPTDATPWMRWDIHDDDVLYPTAADDPVDSILDTDQYTRVGILPNLSAAPTAGPFDPLRADETLLSDGKLDAGDAPMPAARIDVTIAPNSGAPGDTSGVGYLGGVSKEEAYSRDRLGTRADGNRYAPYYLQWIPATSAGGAASGVDGSYANNFNGFLVNGPYLNWAVASVLRSEAGAASACRLRGATMRALPSGAQNVAVYTDEHGEAQVAFYPGTGAYWNNLAGVLNDNGGCDLQGIDVLGTASITATARYPFQPVTDPAKVSAPITKTMRSLFSKTLAYFAKGPGAENAVARIVVAHAQDVDGSAFAGERVCFMADASAEGMKWFGGTTGPAGARIDLSGSSRVEDPEGIGRLCVLTDERGNAAVEVYNSNGGVVNVIADFVDEGILRHVFVDYATDTGGTPPGSGGSSGGNGSEPPAGTPTTPKPRYSLAVARVVKTKAGRVLRVRVNSRSAKKASIRIVLRRKAGQAVVVRTVRTNRLVTVKPLRITKQVRTVRVAVRRVW